MKIKKKKNTKNIYDGWELKHFDSSKNFRKYQYDLINKFITQDEIYKFITRYIKTRKNEWENIKDHLLKISTDISKYIENKILLTLKN